MYPQDTVNTALHLSAIGVLDIENARICGVSVAAIRHWRSGRRRGAVTERGRACPRCHRRHEPGRKHHRKIELEQWQFVIVQKYPGEFARGLFHSDGWRGVNRVRRRLADGDRWYDYPRYMSSNESADILRLCGETLARLGVAWRYSRPNVISVTRREAVARLDEFVGPKY